MKLNEANIKMLSINKWTQVGDGEKALNIERKSRIGLNASRLQEQEYMYLLSTNRLTRTYRVSQKKRSFVFGGQYLWF